MYINYSILYQYAEEKYKQTAICFLNCELLALHLVTIKRIPDQAID